MIINCIITDDDVDDDVKRCEHLPTATRCGDLLISLFRGHALQLCDLDASLAALEFHMGGDTAAFLNADMLMLSRLIGMHGKRRIHLSPPGCGIRSFDEHSVLAMVDAAREGEAEHCRAHLRWLLATEPPSSMTNLLESIGQTLGPYGDLIAKMSNAETAGHNGYKAGEIRMHLVSGMAT